MHAGEGMHPDLVVGPMVHRPPAQPITALQAPEASFSIVPGRPMALGINSLALERRTG